MRARSVLSPPTWSRWAWAGLVGVVLVGALDIALGAQVALASALAVVALGVGTAGRRGDAVLVAGAATLVAAVSGLWDGWGLRYVVVVVVVAAASVVAVAVSIGRDRAEATERRLRLLRRLLELAREATGVQSIAERVLDLLVPALGDAAWLDVELEEERRRFERGGPPPATNDPRATLTLPLATRGAPFGTLGLAVGPSGRRYAPEDPDFAEIAAGRVAVILENAGLTRAAAQTERRMVTALDTLEEAVTMNAPDGRTVYANQAAARLLHVERPEDLYMPEVGQISARFAMYWEDGSPVDYHDLPAFKALAGEDRPAPALIRNVVRETGEDRWLMNRVTVLRDAEGRVDRVVNVVENITEIKEAELRERLLSEATQALSGSLDYEQTLQRVAEVAVPRLADWCVVDLPGRRGAIEPVAIAHRDPERRRAGVELRERYPVRLDSSTELARVVREGESSLIPSVSDEEVAAFAQDEDHLALLREVGFGSIAIVPLVAGGQPLGAITLVRSDPLRRFSDTDLALAEELGHRAGIAVLNARLYGERSRIARELQAGIKPAALPPVPGLEIATLYRPAGELNEVGGDFYDAFKTPAGWLLAIGDVEGQGARAAALTSLSRYTLRSVAQLTGDPVEAVLQVNRTLREQPEMSLCTIAVVLLRAAADGGAELVTLSCGHPVPVLVRDGEPVEVGSPSPLLGAFDDPSPQVTVTRLRDGDGVVLYTDGVLDATGEEGRFEKERLLALLRGYIAPPSAVVGRLDAALTAFQVGDQRDDTAIVAVAVRDASALARDASELEPHARGVVPDAPAQ